MNKCEISAEDYQKAASWFIELGPGMVSITGMTFRNNWIPVSKLDPIRYELTFLRTEDLIAFKLKFGV